MTHNATELETVGNLMKDASKSDHSVKNVKAFIKEHKLTVLFTKKYGRGELRFIAAEQANAVRAKIAAQRKDKEAAAKPATEAPKAGQDPADPNALGLVGKGFRAMLDELAAARSEIKALKADIRVIEEMFRKDSAQLIEAAKFFNQRFSQVFSDTQFLRRELSGEKQ